MQFKKGDRLAIDKWESEPGRGVSYEKQTLTADEDGFAGGWDVWDSVEGPSFYGFSVLAINGVTALADWEATP